MKMSPIANLKSCLEAACLSMLKETRSPDVANCSNFHLVWVSFLPWAPLCTQNNKTWKKNEHWFFTYERTHQNHRFWPFFLYFRQKFNKIFCSDTLFYCIFCRRIKCWGQLDCGNAQECLKILIFADKKALNLLKFAKICIFRHLWVLPESNWPQILILQQNLQ